MKIHKENVKLYFKDKNTIIAVSLLFVFLCAFFYTLFPSSTAIKGIAELFSTSKIEQIYSNNYSTIYAVDENNKLYYSFDKRVPGHLNNFEGITSLDNEYGDATSHFYNFISLSYEFSSKIVKVDGFRDNMFGLEGYTLILTEFNELYALYNNSKKIIQIASDIIDMDAGYFNFTVLTKENKVYEYINKNAYFYRIDPHQDNVKMISTQGQKKIEDNLNEFISISYYVTDDNKLIKNSIVLYYNIIERYDHIETSMPETFDIIQENINHQQIIKEDVHIKQICSIENTTLYLTSNQEVYGIGDNYMDEDIGIFGVNEKKSYEIPTKLNLPIKNIQTIYTSGPFGLILKSDDAYYYSGNVGFDHSTTFKKINQFGKMDTIITSLYTTIVIKKGIVYYINYDSNNQFVRMYDNFIVHYIVRYVSVFLIVMTLFYLVLYFIEENKKYNRYFKERYRNEKNECK